MAETEEERRDRLAGVALEWADRIRTEPVNGLAAELLDALPRLDLYGLIGLLGGAADPTVPASIWWGWVRTGVTAMTAEPIRWDLEEDADDVIPEPRDPHEKKSEPDPIDLRIAELAADFHTDREIGKTLGLSRDAVNARRRRMNIPSGWRPGIVRKRPAEAVPEAA